MTTIMLIKDIRL